MYKTCDRETTIYDMFIEENETSNRKVRDFGLLQKTIFFNKMTLSQIIRKGYKQKIVHPKKASTKIIRNGNIKD